MSPDTKKPRATPLRWAARLLRAFPAALEKLHLQWALAELQRHNPMHPDLPEIVLRIHALGGK